jgi:hypothetical protein
MFAHAVSDDKGRDGDAAAERRPDTESTPRRMQTSPVRQDGRVEPGVDLC